MRIHGDLFPLCVSNYFRKLLEKEKKQSVKYVPKTP